MSYAVCVISEQVFQFKIKFWFVHPQNRTSSDPSTYMPSACKSISIFHDSRVVCNTFCRFTLGAAWVVLLCWSTKLPLAVSEAKHLHYNFALTLNTHFRFVLSAPAGGAAVTAALAACAAKPAFGDK